MFPTHIPTSLPMKSILTTSTTTITPNVEVYMLKLQSKKGLNLGERVLGSSTTKPVTTSDSKYKGNGAYVQTYNKTEKETTRARDRKIEVVEQYHENEIA